MLPEYPILTKKAYKAVKSWSDLGLLFSKKGYDLDPKELYLRSKDEWWVLNRKPQVGLVDELPGDRVDINGTSFYINGIGHDGEFLTKYYIMEKEVKNFLQREVDRFFDSGAAVYVEERFKEMAFSSQPVIEMDDLTHFSDPKMPKKSSESAIFPKFEEPISDSEKKILKHCAEFFHSLIWSLSDKNAIANVQNATYSWLLPEQLEREFLAKNNTLEFITICERSRYMAEYMLRDAKNKGLKKAHAVVGVGHQPGMAYYLNQIKRSSEKQ